MKTLIVYSVLLFAHIGMTKYSFLNHYPTATPSGCVSDSFSVKLRNSILIVKFTNGRATEIQNKKQKT